MKAVIVHFLYYRFNDVFTAHIRTVGAPTHVFPGFLALLIPTHLFKSLSIFFCVSEVRGEKSPAKWVAIYG